MVKVTSVAFAENQERLAWLTTFTPPTHTHCFCHLLRFNSVILTGNLRGGRCWIFSFFVHFLCPYREKGLLISVLRCWISNGCISRFGLYGLLLGENKADHSKNSVWFILSLWKCFKGNCLLNGFPSYIMISSALLKSFLEHLLSRACMENRDVCALWCYLTLLPFSLCHF